MSSIEVSLITSNDQVASAPIERSTLRPQRPSQSPPTQTQSLTKPVEKAIVPLKPEISQTIEETPTTPPKDNANNNPTSLLSEFKRLFDNFDYESVREEILNRRMMECNFTTVLWRLFLHCLSRNSMQWSHMIDTLRSSYEKLVQKYKTDPYKMSDDDHSSKHLNHPLSRDENSSWAQYFADKELKATITIDVCRTCPDISFFRDPRIIELQLNILFAHSRHHHLTIPYRQGMHEILGIIVHSIHSESLKVYENEESNELMKKLYDPQYLEHDAYTIFEKIMDHLRQFYAFTNNQPAIPTNNNKKDSKRQPFQRSDDVHMPANDAVVRMNSIFERLGHYDPYLHCKLQELTIEPTVYGIRWLRLLFGREIPFESIPNLWTVIFCFDEQFGFVDYFFIALLMELGQIIGKQEEREHCNYLQSLMKQNAISNAESVIRKALNLTGKQVAMLPEEPIISSIEQTNGTPLTSIENNRDNTVRPKIQRISIAPAPQPRLTRPHLVDDKKLMSNPQTTQRSDSPKRSSSNNFSSNAASPVTSLKLVQLGGNFDSEMDSLAGPTVRQRYEKNIQLQKNCAEYMHKFIERLQTQICNIQPSNEDELLIQISGLKQIANILEDKLTYDGNSLQAVVDYKCKEKPQKISNNETDQPS